MKETSQAHQINWDLSSGDLDVSNFVSVHRGFWPLGVAKFKLIRGLEESQELSW